MQYTTEQVQDNYNGSASAVVEGSTSMTIEYLRARLHSERSITTATRERANELAERVAELEEQLKTATIQRKKAEKATLDVLALLENHGMVEFSDEYDDSDSDLDESFYEGNLDKGNSVNDKESSVISKQKDSSSGLEHESTPSIGRSLSWKSSKGSPRSRERKCPDPFLRKRSSFVQSASSRHRVGKSCRQIKRREVRSNVEVSRCEPRNPDVDGNAIVDHSTRSINGLYSRPDEMSNCSEYNDEKALLNSQILVSAQGEGHASDGSVFVKKHTSDIEMERALQHQEHLIGRYASEEKAQRDWEEKYMGNGCNIPDSCEPGNQSDVTEERDVLEERDEAQVLAASPTKNVPSNSSSHKSIEQPISTEKGSSIAHVDNFKYSPNPATESSRNSNSNEVHSCRTSASDFVFPVVNETHMLRDNYITNSPSQSSRSQHHNHPLYSHTVPSIHSVNNYTQAETTSSPRNKEFAIVPHENPQRLGGILDALQQAKQLLGKNISSLPSKETVSTMRDVEIAKMAVGSAGLFRVPTDFQFEASGPQTTTVQGSSYPLYLNDYRYHASVPLTRFDQNLPSSMETRSSPSNLDPFFSRMPASCEHRVSSSKSWYGTSMPPSTGFTTYSSKSTYPDMSRRLSSSESSFTVQSPSRTSGLPPTFHPFSYNDHIRPDMYR